MTFKYTVWYPIAIALTAINLVWVAFTVDPAEPWHATIHAVLALGFGLWAQHLRRRPGGGEPQTGLGTLEAEVSKLRQELTETQERLDFAERLLAQGRDPRRADPLR